MRYFLLIFVSMVFLSGCATTEHKLACDKDKESKECLSAQNTKKTPGRMFSSGGKSDK